VLLLGASNSRLFVRLWYHEALLSPPRKTMHEIQPAPGRRFLRRGGEAGSAPCDAWFTATLGGVAALPRRTAPATDASQGSAHAGTALESDAALRTDEEGHRFAAQVLRPLLAKEVPRLGRGIRSWINCIRAELGRSGQHIRAQLCRKSSLLFAAVGPLPAPLHCLRIAAPAARSAERKLCQCLACWVHLGASPTGAHFYKVRLNDCVMFVGSNQLSEQLPQTPKADAASVEANRVLVMVQRPMWEAAP